MKNAYFLVCILFALCVAGCTEERIPMQEYSGYAQGTTYHILCDSRDSMIGTGIEVLLAELEASVSVWDSLSILSRFNREAKGIWVDQHFLEVLSMSKKVHAETDGAFNPALFPILKPDMANTEGISVDSLLRYTNLDDIVVATSADSLTGGKVFVSKKYALNGLDFQGLVKGYVVDRICDLLDARMVENYRVDVGKQVRCKGSAPNGKQWEITIDRPTNEGEIRQIETLVPLGNRALSISGDYRQFYVKSGRRLNTHIDPKTGHYAEHQLINVYVFAPTAFEADAYATAFMVMGAARTTRFLERNNSVWAYLISSGFDNDFQTWISPELEIYIKEKKQ